MFFKKQDFQRPFLIIKSFKHKKDVLGGLIILIILLSGALIYRYLARSNILHEIIKPALKAGRQLPFNYFQGLLSNPEKISIDIKSKNYEKILQKRDEFLKQQLLTASDADYVPAVMHYNGQEIPIKIRLKGDAIDHIDEDKWSFRIQIKGENVLFGMQRFSIQDPKRRNYLDEWIFHKFLEKENLLSLRYKFIDVTLNGKHMGTYVIEENFSNVLVANNRLPEGPILKFNEDLFFSLVLRSSAPYKAHVPDPRDEIYIANPIDSFEPAKKMNDTEIYKQFQTAKNLLEGFRMGFLTTSQAFDVKKFAKFFAIADLINAIHATGWTNIRLYFNPITSLLEPVGYDAFTNNEGPITRLASYPQTKEELEDSIYDFRDALFKDTTFFEEYLKQLYRMTQPGYIEGFFNEIDNELKNNLHIIWRDRPWYSFSKDFSSVSPDIVYQNREYIRNALNPIEGIRAYLKQSTPKIIVEVANIQPLPIIFQGKLLPGRIPDTRLVFQDFELQKLPDTLDYKILGLDAVHSAKVIPWTVLDLNEIEKIKQKLTPNYYLFDFLSVDYGQKTILIKPGNWILTRDLIIPFGFTFIAGPGSAIDVVNSAKIISYAHLEFVGSEDWPVKITSSDKTSKGIWVYAPEKSYLENAVIANNLVNFYESPSFINKTHFLGSPSYSSYDDILHIIRSDFELVDSSFNDAFSDSLDVDFGKGTILRTSFNNSGNDAMDFSGTVVSVQDSQIKGAGDKGVSVGEDSHIEVKNLTIFDANVGLASKDLSVLNAENVVIDNAKVVGVTVYQKKPEFGPARAIISNLQIKNTAKEFLAEKDSFLEINGRLIESNEVNLYKKLYPE